MSVRVIQMEGRCARVSYRWKVGVCACHTSRRRCLCVSYRLKIGVCVCDTGGRQVSVRVIQMEGRCVHVSYK